MEKSFDGWDATMYVLCSPGFTIANGNKPGQPSERSRKSKTDGNALLQVEQEVSASNHPNAAEHMVDTNHHPRKMRWHLCCSRWADAILKRPVQSMRAEGGLDVRVACF